MIVTPPDHTRPVLPRGLRNPPDGLSGSRGRSILEQGEGLDQRPPPGSIPWPPVRFPGPSHLAVLGVPPVRSVGQPDPSFQTARFGGLFWEVQGPSWEVSHPGRGGALGQRQSVWSSSGTSCSSY